MNELNALSIRWDILPYINGQGLDLGCGNVRPHDWMVGVDIRPGTTDKGPNIIGDARDLRLFADESQDYIFSSFLLNELDDYEKVLAEWWRLIKPNGYLILFLPVTDKCEPKTVIDALLPLRPWQVVEARTNGQQFFHVYRKCAEPTTVHLPQPEKICVVVKLGAHGDALWASSVFPHLKAQGYYTILYTQATGETVLRHDPFIDRLICFESRVPIGELGELFRWLEAKYQDVRILVECVEGTLLPSPQKIQYQFPTDLRDQLMNFNYLETHHRMARVPLEWRVKFYPSEEEKKFANALRSGMKEHLVVIVPNGSSVSKYWPYAAEFVSLLLNKREDVTVVMLGDERGFNFSYKTTFNLEGKNYEVILDDHPRFIKLGLSLDVRQAMTLCQLADVVIGQETGLVNSVSFELDVHKIVLLSHSSEHNLTRDWPNTTTIRKMPPCAPCHRLHYDWSGCVKHPTMDAAICQEMISANEILQITDRVLDGKSSYSVIPLLAQEG